MKYPLYPPACVIIASNSVPAFSYFLFENMGSKIGNFNPLSLEKHPSELRQTFWDYYLNANLSNNRVARHLSPSGKPPIGIGKPKVHFTVHFANLWKHELELGEDCQCLDLHQARIKFSGERILAARFFFFSKFCSWSIKPEELTY